MDRNTKVSGVQQYKIQCLASNKKFPGMHENRKMTHSEYKYQSIETELKQVLELTGKSIGNVVSTVV